MEACLQTRTDYIDTANYEPENTDDPEWRRIYESAAAKKGLRLISIIPWQWAYRKVREGRHHRAAGTAASTRRDEHIHRICEEALF